MRLWPGKGRTTIPLVRLSGTIGMGSGLRPGLSLDAVEGALAKAFAQKGPCVALAINSPGGSPAQSSLIANRIRRLAAEKDKTVLAFVEDVAASGGYWLACAADEIHADATSIVGSIGVISASFGFTELIQKIGVERRVYTTGENKSILDPFKPEQPRDLEILHDVQGDIYEAFVAEVKARRGSKLSGHPDLFTGRFWAGSSALELGLIDGIGAMRDILRARYGDKVRIKKIGIGKPSLLRRFGLNAGLSADAMIGAVRADRLYDRYGL